MSLFLAQTEQWSQPMWIKFLISWCGIFRQCEIPSSMARMRHEILFSFLFRAIPSNTGNMFLQVFTMKISIICADYDCTEVFFPLEKQSRHAQNDWWIVLFKRCKSHASNSVISVQQSWHYALLALNHYLCTFCLISTLVIFFFWCYQCCKIPHPFLQSRVNNFAILSLACENEIGECLYLYHWTPKRPPPAATATWISTTELVFDNRAANGALNVVQPVWG